ncbi:glycosyltransferase family 2 protein [Commensalibacter oyaizuii]|uniref:Glycosyltransferase family 2 protein n=1 Tax=Commensalibacter oyaizuii TaxID=3043873 RepID=A0ABT6Q130_9PROT|nr:glycosyltransferase family 2 protein [Commensalibacter sp. TBRC 16381]MDI2090789.1 glycosyltransferase family 2 protein [Commensalibacter sp. TBRC 16381]
MQFFYLKNAYDGYLYVATDKKYNGQLCVSSESDQENFSRLIGFCLYEHPSLLFLCAEKENTLLRLSDRAFVSTAFPVGIEGGIFAHTISLYDLQDHSWLSIPPIGVSGFVEKQEVNRVYLCGLARQKVDWEAIKLQDINVGDVPFFIQKLASCYEQLFSSQPNIDSIKKVMNAPYDNDIKRNVINAFYPLMGVKELDEIVNQLRHSPDFKRQFLETFGDDFWIQHALSPLLSWETDKHNRSIIVCDQKYDHLDQYFKEREFSSITHAINCSYRRTITPKKKACVVTTIRNEGISILEWIAWYKKLGFEHFFIFSNNNDDGSDELLRSLAEAGEITWLQNEMGEGVRPQAKVCKYAFSALPEVLDYEWCLVLDIDEFLSINRDLFQNIKDLLRWIERNNVDAVGFNWQYTSSSKIHDLKQLVTQRVKYFVSSNTIGAANCLIKSMSKPRYMISAADHCAIWSHKYHAVYRLIQGDIHRYAHNQGGYTDDPIWADYNHRGVANVIHYHYKSASEFLLRLYRGNALDAFSEKNISLEMFNDNLIETFVRQHMQTDEPISENFLYTQYELHEIIEELLKLPNVRKAYYNILRITELRVNQMMGFMYQHKGSLGDKALKLLEYAEEDKIYTQDPT